ncbi:ankyrin repeat domain-containing protein 17-like [Cotesia glomerata]|uniref:ankyrin repeat domain-containing protein 17-like n=1 Tax=Cotesia glomerata TaxID=32391 RepID=UPI001D0036BB|nr:ankyrin repeat domain-containing protein 17-like [Cotesia glomerata]
MEQHRNSFKPSQFISANNLDAQARLNALLGAAGLGELNKPIDGKYLTDHEVLRRLTSHVSNALDEASAELEKMRRENPREFEEKMVTEESSVHETTEELATNSNIEDKDIKGDGKIAPRDPDH